MTLEPLDRMSRDIRASAKTLGRDEARFLVDAYYTMQKERIAADGRVRAMTASGEPHSVLSWLSGTSSMVEQQIKGSLAKYVEAHPMGVFLLETRGIGPVIAAGLLAHIDPHRASSVSAVWRFAGLDPTCKWGKGQKRPWNAALKLVCWKLGESFVKSGKGQYRELYEQRKALEIARNDAGQNAETAARQLQERNYGKTTDAYKALSQGKLPAAQIHLRATRYAVKIFLSHLWEEWRKVEGLPTASPWVIAHGGHVDKIERRA